MTTVEHEVECLVEEAAEDFIGLWEVIRAAKEILEETKAGDGEGDDAQRLSLDIAGRMLARGLRAGNISEDGEALQPWPDQKPASVINRIRVEWNGLGREPSIGDICWFDRPKQV